MADEAFALSPISARASLPSEADYEAIREAFMETSRGRWFLDEYGKRNRNADTRMVLDAVARIEATVAAQKPAPAAGLLEAMGKIRSIVNDGKASAAAAMAAPISDEVLAAAREGARILRDIAWTLRECGADIRICDLLDTQVKAIDASQQQDSASVAQATVLTTFDVLMQQIEALAVRPAAGGSPVAATTPETAEAAPADVVTTAREKPVPSEAAAEMPVETSAGSTTDDAGTAEQAHGTAEVERTTATPIPPVMLSQFIVEDRSKALEDIAIVERDIAPKTEGSEATALAVDDAASNVDVSAFAAREETAGDPLAERLHTAEPVTEPSVSDDFTSPPLAAADIPVVESATAEHGVADVATAQVVAEDPTIEAQTLDTAAADDVTSGALPTVNFAADIPEAQDHEAEDMAVLDMVAQEMAEPDLAEPETAEAADAPPEIAEEPISALEAAIELERAAAAGVVESVSTQTETPLAPEQPSEPSTSLGAALIANGVLSKPALPAADPLGPIKRMSQADKIAFFA